MLEVDALHAHYAKSHILHGVSLTVGAGEIVCLLGRNGVGKSTTLKSLMGLVKPSAGTVRFKGQDITGFPAHRVARLGLGYVPEERRIFPTISVKENLLIGIKRAQRATVVRTATAGRSTGSTSSSRGSASARASGPARCPVVNSRC